MESLVVLVVLAIAVGLLVQYHRDGRARQRLKRIAEASRSTVVSANAHTRGETMTHADSAGVKTTDERKQILGQSVANQVASPGHWRIESQSDFNAVLVKGKPVNHVLHLLLTLVTIGFWAIVWIVVAVAGGEKRYMVTVDEYGNTLVQNL